MSDDKLVSQIKSGSFGFAEDFDTPAPAPQPVEEDLAVESAFTREDVSGVQFLTFHSGDQIYGVPLEVVHTVLNTGNVSRYPAASDILLGGFQFRNEVMPLVNLSACLDEVDDSAFEKTIVVDLDGRRIGFAVQSIRRAQRVAYTDLAPVSEEMKISTSNLFDAVASVDDDTILILSPPALFARLGADNE